MQLNDLLSLGQHRIWKRMTVSWTGYFLFLILFLLVFFLFENYVCLFVCLFNVGIVDVRAKMGDCALDLCCGSGDLAFLLSEKVGSNGKVCSPIVPTLALL